MLWGPAFFPCCVLFFFFVHLSSFPLSPLSVFLLLPLFLTLPSHAHTPTPQFVEVKLLAAWELVPYKSPTPTVKSVQAGQTQRPFPLPFPPFSASV